MGHSKHPKDNDTPDCGPNDPRSFLECLTGPSRGRIHWLSDYILTASVGADRLLRTRAGEAGFHEPDDIAVLKWREGTYSIEACEGCNIWVNGRRIGDVSLLHGDMIEFGELGPMSRFRLCSKSYFSHRPVDEILGDAIAYARTSRRPLLARLTGAFSESGRRIVFETSLFFRIGTLAALLLFAVFGYRLYQNDRTFEASLAQEARKTEAVAVTLAQTRAEALTPEDLDLLKRDLELQVTLNAERLGSLESRRDAPARLITASVSSVAFIQGAYGLRHLESGNLLRHVLGPRGDRLQTPFGQPWIEPDGTGEPAEFQFTGTGFLLKGSRFLVTNRHVALPWTSANRAEAFDAAGLAPEMLRLVVFLPDAPEAIGAELHRASEAVDLAVLSLDTAQLDAPGLELAETLPHAGDELYLLGYPTGLRALLAQAGPRFLDEVGENGEVDFWTIAARLSERDLVRPLASRGIVARTSPGAIVYDAETTVGGSGGPALNADGKVVAVNAAILPEFGGSNIGVPVSHLRDLLDLRGD